MIILAPNAAEPSRPSISGNILRRLWHVRRGIVIALKELGLIHSYNLKMDCTIGTLLPVLIIK